MWHHIFGCNDSSWADWEDLLARIFDGKNSGLLRVNEANEVSIAVMYGSTQRHSNHSKTF